MDTGTIESTIAPPAEPRAATGWPDSLVAGLGGARNAADAAIADFVADRLEADDWFGPGLRSLEHFVTWQFGLTASHAAGFVAMARRRSELPQTFGKFRAGELSFDQVTLLVRHCPTEFEESASEFAVMATITQIRRSLSGYAWPEPKVPDRSQSWKKRASFVTNDNGDFRLHVTGDAEEGARVEAVLSQYWQQTKTARTEDDGEPVTHHEAFMAMVDSAADADLSTSRRNRHRTLLHIEANDLVAWANGLVPQLHLGPLIDAGTMRLLTCDGAIQLVVSEFGTPVRLGRSSRVVPDWSRDLMIGRDGGCRFCGSTKGLDVHHIVHWADGGGTDPHNLVALCARHHTMLHQGDFGIVGNPELAEGSRGSLTFVGPDGKPLTPPRPVKPDDPPGGCYQHPLGERLSLRDVHFNPNCNPNIGVATTANTGDPRLN